MKISILMLVLMFTSIVNAEVVLDEIIVTASRQGEQSLQTIPSSITVVKTDTISGSSTLEDIAPLVPSLSIEQSSPGLNKIDMRGISTGSADVVNNLEDRPLVAVYVDDTPIATQGFNPDLKVFDIARVEILRGPQGTLYGAGSMGGTIRYITVKPSTSRYSESTETTLSYTQGGGLNYGIRGSVNMPVSNDTALLITGYSGRNSGWIDNVENGQTHINWDKSTQGRVALKVDATNDLSLSASVILERLDTGGSNNTFSQLGKNKYASLSATPINDDMKVFNFTAEYLSNWGNVISSTSYIKRTIGYNDTGEYLSMLFFGIPPMNTSYINQNKLSQLSQEIRYVSNQDAKFKWVVGGFYNHLTRNNYQDDNGLGFDAVTGIDSVSLGGFRQDSIFSGSQNIQEHDIGIFGEGTYSVTNKLDFTVGARYFDWHQKFNLYFGGVGGSNTVNVDGNDSYGPLTVNQSANAKGINPRFVVSYNVDSSMMIFAEMAKGFRYGGVNQAVPNGMNSNACGAALQELGMKSAPISFGADSLWSYSVGEKMTYGKFRLNASAFLIKWSNVQTSHYLNCSYTFTQNDGAIKSIGGEVEIAYAISGSLDMSLNGSYTSATADGAIPNVGAEHGDRTPYFPRYLGSTSLAYTKGSISINAEYQYHGDSATRFNSSDTSYRVLPAYTNVNMSANLKFSKLNIGIFVKNLFNNNQVTMISPDVLGVMPGDQVSYARPRTIGLKLSTQF